MRERESPVFDLGLAPYEEVQGLQGRLRRAIAEGTLSAGGVLLLLEHPPVITLGSRGGEQDLRRPREVLADSGVQVLDSERGGQTTLHAPGQLISYPIMPIPRRDLRALVSGLEQVLIEVLARYGVRALRREGRPGLYAEGRKIASVGLRCERWIASHGTSLNVDPNLRLFDDIVSCGEAELRQTSIAELTGTAPEMAALKRRYRFEFGEVFDRPLATIRRVGWSEVEAELGLDRS
ncbi:MAG TPA: lipoyl(octanoyl) transferase LipB [Thermoleophilia bacterium]|nr:lipoyl(octanoyl) transferase LipB [Thermoleophilia bacterium]